MTLLGVALENLEEAGAGQLALPLGAARASALDATLDDLRDRFGSSAVTRAVLLGREDRADVPLLPD